MGEALFVVMMTSVSILAAVAVLWIAVYSRSRVREMEHRERLAMIERGLVPPPERDPAQFEQRLMPTRISQKRARSRSAGVLMIGFGLALMILITFTGGGFEIGVGIGGAFAIVGAAFFVNSLLIDDQHTAPVEPRSSTPSGNPLGPTS